MAEKRICRIDINAEIEIMNECSKWVMYAG
jgi:hypothetical protein